jgi:hypothetical protein
MKWNYLGNTYKSHFLQQIPLTNVALKCIFDYEHRGNGGKGCFAVFRGEKRRPAHFLRMRAFVWFDFVALTEFF